MGLETEKYADKSKGPASGPYYVQLYMYFLIVSPPRITLSGELADPFFEL